MSGKYWQCFCPGCLSSFPQDCWAAHTDLLTHICSSLKQAMGSWLPQRASHLSLLKQEWRLSKVTPVPSFRYQLKNWPHEIEFPQESHHERREQRGTAWILKSQGDSWVVVCLPNMPDTLSSILSTSGTTRKKENPRENPKDWILTLAKGGPCLLEEKQNKTKSNKQNHYPVLVICQYTVSHPCISPEIWTKLEWWDNGEMSDTQEWWTQRKLESRDLEKLQHNRSLACLGYRDEQTGRVFTQS